MRLSQRRLALVLAFVLGFSGAVTAAAQVQFVKRSGADFSLDGKVFRHVGLNLPGLLYQNDADTLYDLDQSKLAGIRQVRLFLPNDTWSTTAIGNRLQWVLDRAYERGLRVTVALTHNYNQDCWPLIMRGAGGGKYRVAGDAGFYSVAGEGGTQLLNADWIWWGYQLNYKPFAEAIVARFKNHPGVFAWNIANEVKPSNIVDYENANALVRFNKAMADAIKAKDPNHLVTTGLAATQWAFLAPEQADDLYRHANIDYVTIHCYNTETWQADIDRAAALGKPIVVEEFGISKSTYPSDFFTRVQNAFTSFYSTKAVDAVMVWGGEFSAHGSGDAQFGPLAQGKLAEYKTLWSAWARSLGTGNAIDETRYFVRQDYLDILGRLPDPGGWDGWTNSINACGTNSACVNTRRADTVRAFLESGEFQAVNPPPGPKGSAAYNGWFVNQCYSKLLRRGADSGGYNTWVNYLSTSGNNYNGVVSGFILSGEYRSRFGLP